MSKNPYKILGLPIDSSIDEVKRTYKLIALKSHPDKLNNITDTEERNKKIKDFIEATNAYNKILKGEVNNFDNFDDCDFNFDFNNYNYEDFKFTYEDWEETFNNIRNSDLMKNLVNMYMKYKSKPAKKHNINVDIKYSDYFNTNKKKLRLFLKGVEEPVYINLNCKQYPSCTINYIDDNDNEHEINIKMIFINDKSANNDYYHLDEDENNETNKINLYYDLNIDTIDYIIGGTKELLFVNKEKLIINIEEFTDEKIIDNYGINGGSLIINYNYKPINKDIWNKLSDADKREMIRILEKLKMI